MLLFVVFAAFTLSLRHGDPSFFTSSSSSFFSTVSCASIHLRAESGDNVSDTWSFVFEKLLKLTHAVYKHPRTASPELWGAG